MLSHEAAAVLGRDLVVAQQQAHDRFRAVRFRGARFVSDLSAEIARDRQVDAGRRRAGAEATAGESRGGHEGRRERRVQFASHPLAYLTSENNVTDPLTSFVGWPVLSIASMSYV